MSDHLREIRDWVLRDLIPRTEHSPTWKMLGIRMVGTVS